MSNVVNKLLKAILSIFEVIFDFIVYVLGIIWDFLKAIPGFLVDTWHKINNVSISDPVEPVKLPLTTNDYLLVPILFVVLLLLAAFLISIAVKYKNEK